MTDTRQKFNIFPAIDLHGGKVVRLMEGDPERQTNYSNDPGGMASRWIRSGAAWLHVVNLDGAFGESGTANEQALHAVLSEANRANVRIQFGGGLRSLEAIETVLQTGVSRVILGTLAIEQPEVLRKALSLWGNEKIGVSLDAYNGRVKVRGWQSATPILAVDAAMKFHKEGLRWLIFTDIARDGLQTGLNLPATSDLAHQSRLQVIASGGVSCLADVRAAQAAGLAGVIVGKALYEGAINPADLFPQ